MKPIALIIFSIFAFASCEKIFQNSKATDSDLTKSPDEEVPAPLHPAFTAELPPIFKTVLFYESGKPEWAAADRVWISDGVSELVYSASRGGGLETTLSYHRALKGERLKSDAPLITAVYPLSFGVCGGFPEVQEYCMDDRNFVIPIYAEKTQDDEKLRFGFLSGLLNIPVEVKAEKGVESVYLSADEPLSGKASYTYGFPECRAELEGNAGVTLRGNVMKGHIVLSVALPEGEYHNLKITDPEGAPKNIGDFTVSCGKITEYPVEIVLN